MQPIRKLFFILILLTTLACAQDAHPSIHPDLRVDNMDIYWKRAEQKYIHFTFRIFNVDRENFDHTFEVRLSVRASPREDWRPTHVFFIQGMTGHETKDIVYRPGTIADPVIYTGHFQILVEITWHGQVLDSQMQSYP
ncbi:MAG TPA: hypothetical protein VGO93_00425 [Candidatus Xenobia bacterium]